MFVCVPVRTRIHIRIHIVLIDIPGPWQSSIASGSGTTLQSANKKIKKKSNNNINNKHVQRH